MEHQCFVHKDLVYIQHVETKGYLTDTCISYQNGYIVGTQPDQEKNTIWILEKYSPSIQGIRKPNYDNVEIWPNDMIVIRNSKSGNVLTCNISNKSLVTKQIEVLVSNQYEGSGEQQFMLILDDLANIHFNKVRIVNVLDQNPTLHSHKRPYKNPKDVNEVTGFVERDSNDYWALLPVLNNTIKVPTTLRKSIFKQEQSTDRQVQPRIYRYIHNQDRVVIRNSFTGGSLHSHNVNYTHGNKSQEVTWRNSIKRDQNDPWIIELALDNSDITQPIKNKTMIHLIHQGTGKKLMHIKDARTKKKDFLEVTCGTPLDADFLIEGIDMGIPALNTLIIEYPFRLKCVKTSQYLAALNRPSSKTTFQGEVALVGTRDQNTIWMIESVDSLFD